MKNSYFLKFFIAIIVIFGTSALTQTTKAQDNNNNFTDANQAYFWFYVNVKIDEKTDSYKVISAQNNLNTGYMKDFEKDLWSSLANRRIAVGPFLDKNEAMNAKRLFKSSEDRVNQLPVDTVPNTVYWFAIDFKQSDRMRIFIITRNPAAVQQGNENQFVAAFYEQLAYKHFSIGPFYSYELAEMAKRLYRKNE